MSNIKHLISSLDLVALECELNNDKYGDIADVVYMYDKYVVEYITNNNLSLEDIEELFKNTKSKYFEEIKGGLN